MKTIGILVILFSLNVFSQTAPVTSDNFAQAKSAAIAHFDKRIAMMNEMKACISAANDHAAMKACRVKMKGERNEMRSHFKEERDARREARKALKSKN